MNDDYLPELSVSSPDGAIPTVQSSYCWGRLGCADYIGGREMMEGRDPAPVSAGAEIEVRYLVDPAPSELYVQQIGDKPGEMRSVPLDEGRFNAPEEPGIFYYYASAWWKTEDGEYSKGSTSSVFAIEVR
ncbi:hypothetical protein [Saccharibacillus alkalitolerans]|uniref:Uncharacterized protein n=1 Tax=Saccharibacillus alkalitolerans TaxID=2705290 RepID=A0ABX0F4Z0_9BACL|nr:hypothetical protein [Saccharibacillus alkalitolerans]NGZ74673.1 hypothetical protein [Saccharibacillus alkalitolerans]